LYGITPVALSLLLVERTSPKHPNSPENVSPFPYRDVA
jgi:hypothetical protein